MANSILASEIAGQDSINEKTLKIPKDTTLTLEEQLAQHDEGKNNRMREYEREHPIMSVLYPNITRKENGTYALTRSSFLGYCASNDTSQVNKYLSKYLSSPGTKLLFPEGAQFKWIKSIPRNDIYSLTAFHENHTSLRLDTADIESLTIEKYGPFKESTPFEVLETIMGTTEYVVVINLNQDALIKVQTQLDSTTAVLVTVNLNGKKYLSSMPVSNLNNGIAIGQDINKTTARYLHPFIFLSFY